MIRAVVSTWIDDDPGHVPGAREAGLAAHVVGPASDVRAGLAAHGLLRP